MWHSLGYSLQANGKQREGSQHPDRNAQFEHINARTAQHLASGHPVISVDTKKKELVGSFKNAGRELRPKGDPETVHVHDFIDRTLGKVNPYGVYDVGTNNGWVSVGGSAAIRRPLRSSPSGAGGTRAGGRATPMRPSC
jgi:hypothetical protein